MTNKEKIKNISKKQIEEYILKRYSKTEIIKDVLSKKEKPNTYLYKEIDSLLELYKLSVSNYSLRRSPIWKIESKSFIKIVNSSNTIEEVLNFFGLKNRSGNGQTLLLRMKDEGINIEDFKKRKKDSYKNKVRRYTFEEMFCKESKAVRGSVKRYILKHNLIPKKCAGCNQINHASIFTEWKKIPINLILDHINGINNDNTLIGSFNKENKFIIEETNLRFLCGTCDMQSPFHSGKNNNRQSSKLPTEEEIDNKIKENEENKTHKRKCDICTKKINTKNKSGLCVSCLEKEDLEEINYDKIKEEVLSIGYEATGRLYGITGNGIKKRLARKGELPKMHSSNKDKYNILEDFINLNNRLPLCKEKEYRTLQRFRDPDIVKNLTDIEVEELNLLSRWILNPEEKYIDEWNVKVENFRSWIVLNKRIPKSGKDKNEKSLRNWYDKMKNNYGGHTYEPWQIEKINELNSLIEEYKK